jgi:hypothetical protein
MDRTTAVVMDALSGGITAIGYTYGVAAAAVVGDQLAPVVTGRPAPAVGE